MCTALGGLSLGARQSFPRTPAQLAPGKEEMAAGSHRQALGKGKVCTEGACGGPCVGGYKKAAKSSTEEGSLSAQERRAVRRQGEQAAQNTVPSRQGEGGKGTPRQAQRIVTPLTLKTSP